MDPQHIDAFVKTAQEAGLSLLIQFPRAQLVVSDASQLVKKHDLVFEHRELGGTFDLKGAVGFVAAVPNQPWFGARFATE